MTTATAPKTEQASEIKNGNQFVNQCGYSDIYPFELVKLNTANKATIRRMDAERDPTWKQDVTLGGFAGHCNNNHEQRWKITSKPENAETVIRKHKDGVWRDKYGSRYRFAAEPCRFYDYNF